MYFALIVYPTFDKKRTLEAEQYKTTFTLGYLTSGIISSYSVGNLEVGGFHRAGSDVGGFQRAPSVVGGFRRISEDFREVVYFGQGNSAYV